jgi:hypothetical protein
VRTHGKTGSRIYEIWRGMLKQCGNPNHVHYHNYGGRGIKVCERWRKFSNFLADMGEPPPGHSIDRINNDGDYEPSNCRWATAREQQRNRRKFHKRPESLLTLTVNGETRTVVEWARLTGIPSDTIYRRLHEGWPNETILFPAGGRRYVTFNGETLRLSEWARRLGVAVSTIHRRLADGWPLEDALLSDHRSERRLTFNGKTQTLTEWARDLGITVSALHYRLKDGWPLEVALTLCAGAKALNRAKEKSQ